MENNQELEKELEETVETEEVLEETAEETVEAEEVTEEVVEETTEESEEKKGFFGKKKEKKDKKDLKIEELEDKVKTQIDEMINNCNHNYLLEYAKEDRIFFKIMRCSCLICGKHINYDEYRDYEDYQDNEDPSSPYHI